MDSNVSAGANANVMQWLAKVAKANSTAVSLAVLGCGPQWNQPHGKIKGKLVDSVYGGLD